MADTVRNSTYLHAPFNRQEPDASAFQPPDDPPRARRATLARRLLVMEGVNVESSTRAEPPSRRALEKLEGELRRLRRENERLAALAYRDPLTGLRNRRYFSERLGEELCRLRRSRVGAFSVICVDVNDFKRLNDTLGHARGDAALVAIGRLLESLMRTSDLVCRVGGDEFVVLLADTDAPQAQVVLERVRRSLPELEAVGLGLRGLSLGLATARTGDDELRLLSRADEAMYEDKRRARGQAPHDADWARVG